jgi:hypothetical protein
MASPYPEKGIRQSEMLKKSRTSQRESLVESVLQMVRFEANGISTVGQRRKGLVSNILFS